MSLITTAHALSEDCAGAHCYWHHVDEDDAGAYRRCFECKHVYPDGQALIDRYNAGVDEVNRSPLPRWPGETDVPHITDPGQAWFCPECMHDF